MPRTPRLVLVALTPLLAAACANRADDSAPASTVAPTEVTTAPTDSTAPAETTAPASPAVTFGDLASPCGPAAEGVIAFSNPIYTYGDGLFVPKRISQGW